MKERLAALEAETAAIAAELAVAPMPARVQLHPNLPQIYRRKVAELEAALEEGPDREEAREAVRSMIERVVLAPRAGGKGLDATLHGALAGILAACEEGKRKLPEAEGPGSQVSVVAGAGFEPATFRL